MTSPHLPAERGSAFSGSDQDGTRRSLPLPEIRGPQDFLLGMTPEKRAWNQFAAVGQSSLSLPLDVSSRLGSSGLPVPVWKRAIDLVGCVLALPVLGVCTMILTLVTKCVSPGPVFFRQERVGYMGRRFNLYKFRTMKMGADCSIHHRHCTELIRRNAPMTKLDTVGDRRLIPLGWWLRASGLDELPQIINVLRGEMSLVGPRPCLPVEFAQFLSWQRQRCDAVPGLTGLWQVSGKNRTTFEQMIRLDIRYVRQLSACLDLKIILLTVPSLLTQLRDTRRARKRAALKSQAASPGSPTVGATNTSSAPTETASSSPEPAHETSETLLEWLRELQRRSSEARSSLPDQKKSED